jgi:D-glycero-D-manno-heptose 1,7-bisphosphate phosphatase
MQHTKDWTIFLDRDGVINVENEGSYILRVEDFHFYDGTAEAIAHFTKLFKRIIVVTNQKCIGKQLITHEQLATIHNHMLQGIQQAGGNIDVVLYCAALDDTHPCRKPNCGMAYEAQVAFPGEIDFSKSIMIGNNLSDMKFGKAVGMKTIFLTTTKPYPQEQATLIDAHYALLKDVDIVSVI